MRVAIIAALMLTVAVGAPNAKGGAPPPVTKFTGCIESKGVPLTVRDFKLRIGPCRNGEIRTRWPIVGERGPQGPVGPPGTAGGPG